jgi:predicted F0F1-ATPase subunit
VKNNKNFLDYISLITELGLSVVISILIGLFAGLWLDRKLGLKGVFTVILLIFGVIGGFIAAYKLIKELDNK